LYCLARSAAKGSRNDYPSVDLLYADPGEIGFRLSGRNRVSSVVSRRVAVKPYLQPFEVVKDIMVAFSVISDISPDLGRGDLPQYFPVAGVNDMATVSCG